MALNGQKKRTFNEIMNSSSGEDGNRSSPKDENAKFATPPVSNGSLLGRN